MERRILGRMRTQRSEFGYHSHLDRGYPLAIYALVLALFSHRVAVGQDDPQPVAAGVEYTLTRASGQPGDSVSLLLTVRSQMSLASLSVAITFDAQFLRAENVIRLPGDPTAEAPLDVQAPVPAGLLEVLINNPVEAAAPAAPEPEFSEEQGFVFLRLDGGADPLLHGASELFFELQFTILPVPEDFEGPLLSPIGFETIGPSQAPPPGSPDEDGDLVNEVEQFADDVLRVAVPPEVLEDGGVVILGLGEIGFFRRGDANRDCTVDLRDSMYTFGYLFQGAVTPPCQDALDSNDDGFLNLTDGIFTLRWLFSLGSAPAEPLLYGVDPTDDDLSCEHRAEPCPDAL
jgi:hypothetical protein